MTWCVEPWWPQISFFSLTIAFQPAYPNCFMIKSELWSFMFPIFSSIVIWIFHDWLWGKEKHLSWLCPYFPYLSYVHLNNLWLGAQKKKESFVIGTFSKPPMVALLLSTENHNWPIPIPICVSSQMWYLMNFWEGVGNRYSYQILQVQSFN